MAKQAGTLELNSPYCYNLIATHFNQSSVHDNNPIGFLSGYFLPGAPHELFVWQIGLLPQYQGHGLAKHMILSLLNRESCKKVTTLKATISPSNAASLSLFKKIAKETQSLLTITPYFSSEDFPVAHEEEPLITIGPFNQYKNQEVSL